MKYKVGIVCAIDRETRPVLSHLQDQVVSKKAMLEVYEGKIEGIDAAVLSCGVCKVNAAIATQILIDTYDCNVILNGGTAGGIDAQLHVFDTVVTVESAYWDVAENILIEYHPNMESIFFQAEEKLLSLVRKAAAGSKEKIVFGRTMTGEMFIDQEKRHEIKARFQPLTVDMETAAIAHVCYVNEVPFVAVRTISDTEEESGEGNFEQNCNRASERSAEFIREILKESNRLQ